MLDKIRQLSVIVTVIATLIINVLANLLPINGLNTGQISDQFQVYFVPAGYVFSIWGIIYIGLISIAIFQALPSQQTNPRMQSTGWWIAIGGIANSSWIFLWHYKQFPLTLVAMLILLFSLIIVYLRLRDYKVIISSMEKWMVHLPTSIYLGWITVATVANITSLLDYLRWDGFGLSPELWVSIVLIAVLAIAMMMNLSRRDLAFTVVLLWALAGISIKHSGVSLVVIPTWITFGLVALTAFTPVLRQIIRHRLITS